MGRKLIRRLPVEKESSAGTRKRLVATVFLQHVLLWSSVYVVASTAYLIHTGAITRELMPVAAVLLFTGSSTLMCLFLCNVTAWISKRSSGRSLMTSPACLQTLSKYFLRFVVTTWMVSSGLVITFTAAKQPFCLVSSRSASTLPAIDVGVQCMVQRASVAASLLAMITSIGLIMLVLKTPEPYLAHLSGINKPPALLPFSLPYKPTNRPMFSEMSFKCRSTTSLSSSSYTLTDPNSDPLYTLYPTRPEKAYGLGIYAPKTSTTMSSSSSFSTASFLTPRPSLKTLRSQASLARPQPPHHHSKFYPTTSASSPLPPVPTYNPEKYKNFPPLQYNKKSSGPPPPPRRAYTLKREGSQGTLRVVLRSPSCPLMMSDHKEDITNDKAKIKAKDDSKPSHAIINKPLARTQSLGAESLSSVYSRSLSGDDPEPTTTITPQAAVSAIIMPSIRSIQTTHLRDPRVQPRVTSISKQRNPHNPSQHRSGPAPGLHLGAANPHPMRSSHHHHYRQPGGVVRNHFPGPGHQRRGGIAGDEEVRSGGRLPATRAVSGFGDVMDRSSGCGGGEVVSGEVVVGGSSHGNASGSSWAARCGLPPLPVGKRSIERNVNWRR